MVSNLQPPTAVALVANDETRYPASGIALMSGPHVIYNPPALWSASGSAALGSQDAQRLRFGNWIGVPVGRPTLAEVSDQYVASAQRPAPPDYTSNWSRYHIEISAGAEPMTLAAPAPTG